MNKRISLGLRGKMLLFFGGGVVVLIIAINLVSLYGIPFLGIKGEYTLHVEDINQKLSDIADLKKEELSHWFRERLLHIRTVSEDDSVKTGIDSLIKIFREGKLPGMDKKALFPEIIKMAEYGSVLKELNKLRNIHTEYDDIGIIELSSGSVVMSTDGKEMGIDFSNDEAIINARLPGVNEQIYLRKSTDGQVLLNIFYPVTRKNSSASSVILFKINFTRIFEPLLHASGALGKTGEIILVDMNRTLLAPLKYPLSGNQRAVPLEYKLMTKPAELAAWGIDGTVSENDYRGVPVIAAVRHARITSEFGIGMIIKQDKEDIFSHVKEGMIFHLSVSAAGLALLISLIHFIAARMSRPVLELSDTAQKVMNGDLGARSSVQTADEVGDMARSFNRMVEKLQGWNRELEDKVIERTEKLEESLAALKESETKYRRLHESMRDGFVYVNMDGAIRDYNESYRAMLGYTPEELARLTYVDLTPEKWHAPEQKTVNEQILPRGYSEVYEKEYRRKDGTIFPVELRTFLIKNPEGKNEGMWAIVRDITERKKAEEVRLQLMARLEAQWRMAQMTDADTRILSSFILEEIGRMTGSRYGFYGFINDDESIMSIHAWSKEVMKDCAVHDKPIDYPIAESGVWGNAIRERKTIIINDMTLEHANKKGTPEGHIPIERVLTVPVFRGEHIIAVGAVANKPDDYTESDARGINEFMQSAQLLIDKRTAEEALIESEERFKLLIDQSFDGNFIHDKFIVLDMNERMEKITGYSRSELLHSNILDIFSPDMQKHILEYVRSGKRGSTTVELRRKDGNTIYIEAFGAPCRYQGREARIVALRDITERKKLQEQLLQAQKMEAVGQLAGGIAHDFNNILMAIMGYGHLLLMKMGAADPLRTNVETILSSAERAANLTQGLLAFSRKQLTNLSPVDINETIQRVEKLLLRVIGEHISLKVVLPGSKLTIMADSVQMEQVLMNLATNARDAMPDGGVITISTEGIEPGDDFINLHGLGAAQKYALISVADTGSGIDQATVKRIFEPFFTTKEAGKGTGLGLAMVYGIIKQHDGYIDVYSEPGTGTTFRIYLPLVIEKPAESEMTGDRPAIQRGSETILMAEDNDDVRRVNLIVLEGYGYKVIEAVDGADAVKKFMENSASIDLLLFDAVMPNMSGKTAYDKIKEVRPDMKAIFISGYTADFMGKAYTPDNWPIYLSKPIHPEALLNKVREALDALP